jgi:8-oxo-dGTP pyrophosphatase MutT (NUDIX family)
LTLHASAVQLLSTWAAPSDQQDRLRHEYLAHLAAEPDGCLKSGPPAHLTASCIVLDRGLEHVLLTLHRKGRFWVQFGGHCEPGDIDLAATALREAHEESGVPFLELLPGPLDLHRHHLPPSFGRCTEHLDVAFLALAAGDAQPAPSAESDDVAWWPVGALPAGIVPDLPPRLTRAVRLLGAVGSRSRARPSQASSASSSAVARGGRSRPAANPSR